MGLRQIAEADLAVTLEDTQQGGAMPFVLKTPDESQVFPLNGLIGDIGFLLDTEGVPVQGRTINAHFRLSSLRVLTNKMPAKGWKVACTDLAGDNWNLFVVRIEPDRTIGICRMVLGLKL